METAWTLETVEEIIFPENHYQQLLQHCRRKFLGEYLDDETHERKAYGLMGGRLGDQGKSIEVTAVIPLRRNFRHDETYQQYVTDVMLEAGNESKEFPMSSRGWVSDPKEVFQADRLCSQTGGTLFANYHMHTIVGDRCTAADRALAAGNGMWSVLISMVDPQRYIVRAYFESRNEREIPIRFRPDGPR